MIVDVPTDDGRGFEEQTWPRAKALGYRLELAARSFEFHADEQRAPSRTEIAKRLHAIVAASDKLLSALSTCNGHSDLLRDELRRRLNGQARHYAIQRGGFRRVFPDIRAVARAIPGQAEPFVDHFPATAVRRIPWAIWYLKVWATRALRRERHVIELRRDARPHKGDVPFRALVDDLWDIWIDVFEEVPGTSIAPDTGEAGGPFVRFISEVAQVLGIRKSPAAIRAAVRARRPKRRAN